MIAQCLVAQDYRLLEGDVFIGTGTIIGEEEGAFIIGFEPRVNVSDKVSLSVRLEDRITYIQDPYENYSRSFASYEMFGDYYFINNRNRRAFVGFGGGIISPHNRDISFGFSLRTGCELENLRVSVTYNQQPFLINPSKYIGLTFGFTVGGKSRQIDP